MKRIQSTDAAAVLPAASEAGTTGYFTNGDPGTATPATTVTAEWLNSVQEEICYVIEQAGITLDGADTTQLYDAILTMVAPVASEAEVKAGTDTAKAVTPGRITRHWGVAKKVIRFAGRDTDGTCTMSLNKGGTARAERKGGTYYRVLFSSSGSGDNMPNGEYVIGGSVVYGSAPGTVGAWNADISSTAANTGVFSIVAQDETGFVLKMENTAEININPNFIHITIHDDE